MQIKSPVASKEKVSQVEYEEHRHRRVATEEQVILTHTGSLRNAQKADIGLHDFH
jgi:hypothetical protein